MAVTLCVLLWAHADRYDALVDYEDRVLRFLDAHDGRLLQRVRNEPGTDQPYEVQIIEFSSQAAFDAYMTDARRTALSDERDAAIANTEVLRVTPVPATSR
jgi:uncharacterized protein (DUF1330 family)